MVVTGVDAPVLRTAVVLVPVPEGSGATLAAYAKIDPLDPVTIPKQVDDAAVVRGPRVRG